MMRAAAAVVPGAAAAAAAAAGWWPGWTQIDAGQHTCQLLCQHCQYYHCGSDHLLVSAGMLGHGPWMPLC